MSIVETYNCVFCSRFRSVVRKIANKNEGDPEEMSLLRLSQNIWISVLAEWCDLVDFLRWDAAVSRSDSSEFLRCVAEFPTVFESFHRLPCINYSYSFMLWSERRQLTRMSVTVNDLFTNRLRPSISSWRSLWTLLSCGTTIDFQFLDFLAKIVRISVPISFLSKDSLFLSDVLDHCKALDELTIVGSDYEKLLCIPPSHHIQSSCTKLCLHSLQRVDNNSMFPRMFTSLREIHMDSIHSDAQGLVLASIVWCRHLVCFNAPIRDSRLQYMLAFHCACQFSTMTTFYANKLLLTTMLTYRGGEALKTLSIIHYMNSLVDGYQLISGVIPNVTALNLHYGLGFNSAAIRNLEAFRYLRSITLHKITCTDETVLGLVLTHFPVTTLAIRSIAEFPLLEAPSVLRALDISGLVITDERLLSIAQYCLCLTDLNVSGCREITDENLLNILKNGKLECLGVTRTSITSATIVNLYTYCSRVLRMLDVSSFFFVNELLDMIEECGVLRELHCREGVVTEMVSARIRELNRRVKVIASPVFVLKMLQ